MQEWQLFYNYQHPHSALGGKIPAQVAAEKSAQTPFWDEVIARDDPSKERLLEQSHQWDRKLAAKSKKKKP